MTAQVIFAWQRGCKQYRMPSPFRDFYDSHTDIPLDTVERPPIKLVLMGAAALRSFSEYTPSTIDAVPPRVRIISTYGPRY